VSVWMLTRGNKSQLLHTETCNLSCTDLLEPWSETKTQFELTYFVGFLGHHRKSYTCALSL